MEETPFKNYLAGIETVSSAATRCNLDFSKMNDISCEIAGLSSFLGLSSIQTILFCCIAELSFQKTVTLDHLSKHLKCGVFKLIAFINEIEALEKKGYVKKTIRVRGRKHSYNDIGYTIPHAIIEAVRKSDISLLEDSVKCDLPGFLKQVSNLIDERNQNSIETTQLLSELQFLINANLDLPYVEYVDSGLKQIISKCTVFAFSYQRLRGMTAICIESYANALFDDLSEQLEFAQQVCSGRHELVTSNFLNLVTSDFDGDKLGTISGETLKKLYRDYPDLLVNESKTEGVLKYKNITPRDLYFNQDTLGQLSNLSGALEPSVFSEYREALQKNKLSRGITAIFFGAPGTGKTEAVYQLARKTCRDIMMVDLSQTKSKWFGESEKQVKKIFDDYTTLMRNSDSEPILFVNEADGLFTKRIDMNSSKGQSTDQVINVMQNILLQELENFQGILIATSNLTGNLDKAFERRFTFKIDFPKPESSTRKRIWMNKLEELSEQEAALLSEKFEMTGGEIDVQVRQVLLKKVLDKSTSVFDAAMQCCTGDKGFVSKKKIGF